MARFYGRYGTYKKFYRISKSEAREFAELMQEIDDFCIKNNITQSYSGDSYYFEITKPKNNPNLGRWRVSNHSIKSSQKYSSGAYHQNDDENLNCITASKTRIMQIYSDLKAGWILTKRGEIDLKNEKNIRKMKKTQK